MLLHIGMLFGHLKAPVFSFSLNRREHVNQIKVLDC